MNLKEFLMKIRKECREKLTNNNIETYNIKQKIDSEERFIKPERIFPKIIKPETRRGLLLILSLFSTLFSILAVLTTIPFGLLSLLITVLLIYTTITDYLHSPESNYAKEYNLTELYERLNELEKEAEYLKSLVDDISVCHDYYTYVLPPKLKDAKITFDTKTAMNQGCMLSTLLHVYYYYHSHFEEFLKLDKEAQKASEEYLNLKPKIANMKQQKLFNSYEGGGIKRETATKSRGYLLDATLEPVGRRR